MILIYLNLASTEAHSESYYTKHVPALLVVHVALGTCILINHIHHTDTCSYWQYGSGSSTYRDQDQILHLDIGYVGWGMSIDAIMCCPLYCSTLNSSFNCSTLNYITVTRYNSTVNQYTNNTF
jgi:hypothetical protein